jgi:hypothetical protein
VRRAAVWSAALLVPEPPLAFAYLLAIRAERVVPAFAPVVALALFPIAASVLALRQDGGARWVVIGIAVVELASVVLVAAMVGFAKAWRSG